MKSLNRLVRGIACAGIALLVAVTTTGSAQAQTPVVPPGAAGTDRSARGHFDAKPAVPNLQAPTDGAS